MLCAAEDLDADFVIFGSFNSNGKSLTIDCRLLWPDPVLALAPPRHARFLDAIVTPLTWAPAFPKQ